MIIIFLNNKFNIFKIFHTHGINLRYLGWIASNTTLPHIKEICQIEMIARVCKKILRYHLSEMLLNYDKEKNKNIPQPKLVETEKKTISTSKNITHLWSGTIVGRMGDLSNLNLEKMNEEIADIVLDFFNLVLGLGSETDIFWQDILSNQIKHDYQYTNVKRNDIILGGLLHAMCFHCKVLMKFDDKVELGKTLVVFKKEDFLGLQIRAKSYQFKNIEIKLLCEKFREYRTNKNYDLAIKAINIRISIDKALGYNYPQDVTILSDLAEVYLEQGEFENATAKAKQGIEGLHPFHAESVKFWCVLMRCHMRKNEVEKALECFDKSLAILEFHLGPFHPLHATVYSIFGFYYSEKKRYDDAVLLYKSSLVCCLRILGSNHVQTGEVYLDLANLYLKMNQKEDALSLYEKAFAIFEIHKNSLGSQYANTGMLISGLLNESGRVKDACNVALQILYVYEGNESIMHMKLIECCQFIFNCAELLNEKKLNIQFAEKTWNLLDKYAVKGGQFYEKALRSILSVLLKDITTDKKNFLFRIYDCIGDCISKENQMNLEEDEALPFKVDALQALIAKCKNIVSVSEYINDLLFTLFSNSKELYSMNFFSDFRSNLDNLKEISLRE